ncbi:hypothetical protein PILCRDRAFT_616322 [Piloderma croceum F 1598]|uniref:Uncharacterized protein n=1 Tax=Piloderma croceum (strain F 1598) TaxID=765440 RepID=A0A0C3FC94_PILCF|nr:hypothetical protein PILCRDRAFT_616322 [Piloderma croceum F 1598]
MQCISTAEDLVYSKPSRLFVSTSNGSSIGEGRVPIFSPGCPGSTPDDPMVFVHSKCTKRLRVTYPWNSDGSNPRWLPMTVGEILHTTHALPQYQPYAYNNGGEFNSSDCII